jgi:hypothetical protein
MLSAINKLRLGLEAVEGQLPLPTTALNAADLGV